MRRRSVPSSGHPIEHVANVANERTGDRRRVDPSGRRFHLKAATTVLKKDGEEAVVGVLADAPKRCRGLRERGVVEDAEQDQRIPCVESREVGCVEAKAQRDALHDPVAESRQCIHIIEHGRTEARHTLRKKIGTVKRRPRDDFRMISIELSTEINAFFLIGTPGRQLVAHRKITPPRPPPELHPNGELLGARPPKKLPAQPLEPPQKRGRPGGRDP